LRSRLFFCRAGRIAKHGEATVAFISRQSLHERKFGLFGEIIIEANLRVFSAALFFAQIAWQFV
jgi:hypothetical protein